MEDSVIGPGDEDAGLEQVLGIRNPRQLVAVVRPEGVVEGRDLAILRGLLGHVELVAVLSAVQRQRPFVAVFEPRLVRARQVEFDAKVVAPVQRPRARARCAPPGPDVVDEVAQPRARRAVLAVGDAPERVSDRAGPEVVLLRGGGRPLVTVAPANEVLVVFLNVVLAEGKVAADGAPVRGLAARLPTVAVVFGILAVAYLSLHSRVIILISQVFPGSFWELWKESPHGQLVMELEDKPLGRRWLGCFF